jgi:hypothetical protein
MDEPINFDAVPDIETMRAALRLVTALGGGGGSDMLAREIAPTLVEILAPGQSLTDADVLSRVAELIWSLTMIAECAVAQAERAGVDRLDLMAYIEDGVESFKQLRGTYPPPPPSLN